MTQHDNNIKVETKGSSINNMLNERGNNYGSFEGHAEITQALKRILQKGVSWENCTDSQKESLEMVMHKIGRIINGDPKYLDSWVDIIGYTQLIVEQLKGNYR